MTASFYIYPPVGQCRPPLSPNAALGTDEVKSTCLALPLLLLLLMASGSSCRSRFGRALGQMLEGLLRRMGADRQRYLMGEWQALRNAAAA